MGHRLIKSADRNQTEGGLGQIETNIQTPQGPSTQKTSVLDTKDAYVIEIDIDEEFHEISVNVDAHTITLSATCVHPTLEDEQWQKVFYFDDILPGLTEAIYDNNGLMLILPKKPSQDQTRLLQ
ncbi:hypothetical protein G4V62_02730 [Bacillaceae bacterium SIJ1]|uniref:Hsp20/alpha crystallin family protein n=1 Tax=Litoribacterium kuwaitense TaxID=1398745 RepID=UPI0013EDBDAA|nr:Hsp20/alpha crystallin family protein [Litoribacterium kuwaitense]NGP43915.1 hypothetical protein [Litoribacterium kuwaitense]